MTESTQVYIGIGSNQGDPLHHVQHAMSDLCSLPDCRCIRHSSCYRSAPMGPQDQPAYINAVTWMETGLSAMALLEQLQRLEAEHGRVRGGERWGPRPLDLDILLYGDAVIDEPDLQVPHAGLLQRNFVLYPLYEVAPELEIPGAGKLADIIHGVSMDGLELLEYE
jgi:2-amino-4-hydroxy-6-hydroxymethyldihydropteridine diphosphokinase